MTKARSSADFAAGGFFAGKNAIINGDFNIWQRGTSFTLAGYFADRWTWTTSSYPTTRTMSQQAFSPGAAPVAGYESSFFMRYLITTVGSSTDYYISQPIEDVRTFAGKTVTYSFWAKADSARTINASLTQEFGSGGSSSVTVGSSTHSLTTSWQRFTATMSVPSISGKTIGTNSLLRFMFTPDSALASGYTLDIWGVQVEVGTTATPFETATGTIQGELQACQRYYYRATSTNAYSPLGPLGVAENTTTATFMVQFPSQFRVVPHTIEWANLFLTHVGVPGQPATTATFGNKGLNFCQINVSGSSGLTANRPAAVLDTGFNTGYLGYSAEL
jgi:hypothetical protein